MNRDIVRMIVRSVLVLLIQVLILKRIGLSQQWVWQYGQLFLYPVIILLLPFRMSRQYVLIFGFVLGLLIDIFYDSPGVHAFGLTAMAYARGIVLAWFEPRGGYQISMSPTHYSMGLNWLLTYTSILLFVFTLCYFIAEIFTWVYIGKIILRTLVTFVLSMALIMGYHLLFNPRK